MPIFEIRELIWSGNALSAATFSALDPLIGSRFAPMGRISRVWSTANSTTGSIFFLESGTNLQFATLVVGSNNTVESYPVKQQQDNTGANIVSGNEWIQPIITGKIIINGSGFTSGTTNQLGKVVCQYEV